MELLEYIFFRNALIGTLLACVSCGIIGTYIVTRRLLFISGGITHSSFGGVGLGMYFSFSPTLGAFIFAAASALGIQWLGRRREIREDSAIAMLWVLGMTIGVIFCFMTPGYTAELTTYLFGNTFQKMQNMMLQKMNKAISQVKFWRSKQNFVMQKLLMKTLQILALYHSAVK